MATRKMLVYLMIFALSLSACKGGGGSGGFFLPEGIKSVNKTWHNPASLEDHISAAGQDASYPRVAMSSNGDAIITWYQFDDSGKYQIYKSEYRNGAWTNPLSLDEHISIAGQDAVSPEVAMDNYGNAIIVWCQSDGANNHVYKSEYREEDGHGTWSWTHPSTLSDHISFAGQPAGLPQVAMDNNGNAIIAWYQSDGTRTQIYKSEYRDGIWTHPSGTSDHISVAGQYSQDPQVAMGDNGDAIITWSQWDGASYQIYKSEYRDGDGTWTWTNPSSLGDHISVAGYGAEYPQVAMDDNGNAVIAWTQLDGGGVNYQVFMSEFRNGTWNHPDTIDDHVSFPGQNAEYPRIAMDAGGNAIITWAQSDGDDNQIYKSEFRHGAWTGPSSLSDHINVKDTGSDAFGPAVSMDDNGNAIITWYQYAGSESPIYKSEYRLGKWTRPASLEDHISIAGQDAAHPGTAMSNNGTAIITWQQGDGTTGQIFKSEYR